MRSQSPAPHSGAAPVPPEIVRTCAGPEAVAAADIVIVAPENVTTVLCGFGNSEGAESTTVAEVKVSATPAAVAVVAWVMPTESEPKVTLTKVAVCVAALLMTMAAPENVTPPCNVVWVAVRLMSIAVGLTIVTTTAPPGMPKPVTVCPTTTPVVETRLMIDTEPSVRSPAVVSEKGVIVLTSVLAGMPKPETVWLTTIPSVVGTSIVVVLLSVEAYVTMTWLTLTTSVFAGMPVPETPSPTVMVSPPGTAMLSMTLFVCVSPVAENGDSTTEVTVVPS